MLCGCPAEEAHGPVGSVHSCEPSVRARTNFFSVEVFTPRVLVTYYALCLIHLETRRVNIAGVTVHPDERWMQ
jgi:hypothetical protein